MTYLNSYMVIEKKIITKKDKVVQQFSDTQKDSRYWLLVFIGLKLLLEDTDTD